MPWLAFAEFSKLKDSCEIPLGALIHSVLLEATTCVWGTFRSQILESQFPCKHEGSKICYFENFSKIKVLSTLEVTISKQQFD